MKLPLDDFGFMESKNQMVPKHEKMSESDFRNWGLGIYQCRIDPKRSRNVMEPFLTPRSFVKRYLILWSWGSGGGGRLGDGGVMGGSWGEGDIQVYPSTSLPVYWYTGLLYTDKLVDIGPV